MINGHMIPLNCPQIFTGGQEICLKLREQQVRQVFYLVAYGGEVGRAELLGTLQAAVKVNKESFMCICKVGCTLTG